MNQEPGQIPMEGPLGFFLTWTTYGSWLPGDERGWFDKPSLFREPNQESAKAAESLMTESVLVLKIDQRLVVEKTILEHCRIRGWKPHAVNVRTQHVHVVVAAPEYEPKVVMDQFKAWCTRKLKQQERLLQQGTSPIRENWWTQGGSKRRLNTQRALENAIRYVLEDQGDSVPRLPPENIDE
jgi:Transposase IS200 like